MHSRLTAEILASCTRALLANLHRQYPNLLRLVLRGPEDVVEPRMRTPAFFGSFDWHSAVHAHFALVRLLDLEISTSVRADITGALARSFTRENLDAERRHLEESYMFEMPYGIAWLLTLYAELHISPAREAERWRADMMPLAELARSQLERWLDALPAPIRSGEHSQSAFAMTMALGAARRCQWTSLEALIARRARELYESDRDAPIDYEPSAWDFLSPTLAEAELMSQVLAQDELVAWLPSFLSRCENFAAMFLPVMAANREDGKLVHWDGLNLSRAWMLEAIASALPADAPLRADLRRAARQHLDVGLEALDNMHYAGSHWLWTFALYALTGADTPGT